MTSSTDHPASEGATTTHAAPDHAASNGHVPVSLRVYLNDHRGGAGGGLALVRKCAGSNADNEFGPELRQLATDVDEDRVELERIMEGAGVPQNVLKAISGNLTVQLSRLKPNGSRWRYSALTRLLELEALAAGVSTKQRLWETLHELAPKMSWIDADRMAELEARAADQHARIVALHTRAARLLDDDA